MKYNLNSSRIISQFKFFSINLYYQILLSDIKIMKKISKNVLNIKQQFFSNGSIK